MALYYYSVEKTAEVLGVTVEEVRGMRERRELYGYRDGSNWKFKAEDVERVAAERKAGGGDEEDGDVLLSDVELGGSGSGVSGPVIGDKDDDTSGSDIKVAKTTQKLGRPKPKSSPNLAASDELDLSLDDDLTLDDSTVTLPRKSGIKKGTGSDVKKKGPGSDVQKKASESGKDVIGDDELVLGGSGSGSDITIGGDSGIQLVDPADSGLSLEEPLDLSVSSEESLELGEDDMISLSEEAGSEAVTKVKTDDDFLLAPAQETVEEDDESGSQVIALDAEQPSSDQAATMIGTASKASMVALLDEDLAAAGVSGVPLPSPLDSPMMGAVATPVPVAMEPTVVEAVLPETPYGLLSVLGLAVCLMVLVIGGMMAFDLLRTMWSWDSPYQFNSTLMDSVLSMIEG
jgi:excisionase family DNA binding protein